MVRYLLDHGGKVVLNLPDADGETPLHLAADWGSESVFDELLAAGAARSLKNKDGKTPIEVLLDTSYSANLTIKRRKKYLSK